MLSKAIEAVKTALGSTKKVVPISVTPQQIAAMRVRPFKGSKRRPVFVNRPSLKRLQAQMDRLNRAARNFRGMLRKSSSPQQQMDINNTLKRIANEKASVLRYVKGIQTPLEIKKPATA